MTRRRWLVAGIALAALVLIGAFALDYALELALRRPVNAYLRARTLELVRSAEGGGLSIATPHANLHLLRRVLVLDGIRIRYEQGSGERRRLLVASSSRVYLTGVSVIDIIRGRDFRLTGASIESPVILLEEAGPADSILPTLPKDSVLEPLPAPDSLLFHTVQSWLPEEMHGSRIEELRVEGGTVGLRSRRGEVSTSDSISGISIQLVGLSVDSLRHRVFERARISAALVVHAGASAADSMVAEELTVEVTADDTTFAMARARTASIAGEHAVRAVGLRRSHMRQMLTVDTLAYEPPAPDSLYFREARPRSTRVRAVATGLTIMGLPQESVRRRRLLVGGMWIKGLDLDVLADRRTDGRPPRRVLWPARFAAFSWLAGADSIVLESGRISYAELLPDSRRAGRVHFDRLRARVLNATNDPERTSRPLVMAAQARLYGEAPLAVVISVPVRTGPFRARVVGEAGTMPLTEFNRFLLPSDGMKISGGILHQATFRFGIKDGKARGRFQATWEGLGLKKVDRRTGEQDFGDKLVSLIANALTREDNMPDDDGDVAGVRIRYDVKPTDTFWGMMWRSVRSGIVTTVRQ